jgi:hypothetical protein
MTPNNDHLWQGILVGLIVPVVGYFLVLQSNDWISSALSRTFTFKESTTFLIALCTNVVPMGYFRRRIRFNALRGLMVITMLLAVVWFLKFGVEII